MSCPISPISPCRGPRRLCLSRPKFPSASVACIIRACDSCRQRWWCGVDDACGVFQCRPASSPGFPASVRFPQAVESQAVALPCWVSPSGQHPSRRRRQGHSKAVGRASLGENSTMFRRRWFWRLQDIAYRIKMLSAPAYAMAEAGLALGRVRVGTALHVLPNDFL